jgi:hypothetical protein
MPSKNTIRRAKLIQDLVQQHHEPGRQDRCLLWAYRNKVLAQYPMSERTFWRYMNIDTSDFSVKVEDKYQLKLFDE